MISNPKFMKDGDIIVSPDFLIGRLSVDTETKECEVVMLDESFGKCVVRAWNVEQLRKGGWKRYPNQNL